MRVRIVLVALAASILSGAVLVAQHSAAAVASKPNDLYEQIQELRRTQALQGVQTDHLAARVASLEALALERRLTRLETLSESNRTILLGLAGAVGLQLIEMLFRILAGRRPRVAGDEP